MGKLEKVFGLTTFVVVVGAIVAKGSVSMYVSKADPGQLTRNQQESIDMLRQLIDRELTSEYMLEDAFLLKWLLEKDFNIGEAAELLNKNLQWRQKQNINSILDEDWNDMHSSFPYSRDTKDKFGSPVLYLDIGKWNVAKLASEKESTKQLERYFYKILEESEQHIRDLRGEGRNVTQFHLIVNVGDYSLEKHGCYECLYFYRDIGQALAPNYPFASERISFVNVPYLFEAVYNFLGDQNKRSINVLGQDKTVWEPILLETIDKDQLPAGLLQLATAKQ